MKHISALLILCLCAFSQGMLSAQSVSELKAQLRRASSKNEKLQLTYQLAEKQLARSPSEAATYAVEASELAVQLGEKRMASDALYIAAEANYRRRNYSEASRRFTEAWNTARNYGHQDVALQAAEKLMDIGKKQNNLSEALKWSQETINYLKENTGRSTSSGDALRRLEGQLAAAEADNRNLREQLASATGHSEILESSYRQQIQQVQSQTQQALYQRDSQFVLKQRQADSIVQIKNKLLVTLTEEQMVDSMVRAQQGREIEAQKAMLLRAEVERQKSEATRNVLLMLSSFILVVAGLFYLRYRAKRRTANQLANKNKIIEEEQKKSDELLLNILPPLIAGELKTKKKVAAQQYDQATVMFVDFIGFTQVSEMLSPEALVAEIDYCFSNFDRIIGQYRIEKIKTVGDAYICACGLSDQNASPSDMIKAGLQIQDFLLHQKAEQQSRGLPFFEARIGIHTGPVVAGVVGEKKFAYDIWGDTVNIAARMEETSAPGRVNISEETYWKAKYDFEWEPRGKVAAKNKGLLEMYYVKGLKELNY
ncbi:MAG: adenylate/guanylate cyclase domain-containing protein [Lewinellaceae bacterium]|nr:adenylate/guanylate cyclase domain-containing protein [Saprospiraceae bacterium]MCB9315140.1 adenylate/guanylate cyclase domain-containing protein [Lewinellaceae bacterium]MCB9332253.1 adenylate/guanylate cyclase domain-containing protein [Lewinellaceae bacterium]